MHQPELSKITRAFRRRFLIKRNAAFCFFLLWSTTCTLEMTTIFTWWVYNSEFWFFLIEFLTDFLIFWNVHTTFVATKGKAYICTRGFTIQKGKGSNVRSSIVYHDQKGSSSMGQSQLSWHLRFIHVIVWLKLNHTVEEWLLNRPPQAKLFWSRNTKSTKKNVPYQEIAVVIIFASSSGPETRHQLRPA